jgi:hypothetical protein
MQRLAQGPQWRKGVCPRFLPCDAPHFRTAPELLNFFKGKILYHAELPVKYEEIIININY